MEDTMKAILIDVKTQEIKEVEHDNTLQNIYDLIDCRAFDLVSIDDVNSIFVDDEGILKDNLYFEYSGSENVFKLAGNGLILGVDDEGNSISPTLTVEDVKGKVNFLPEGFKVEPYMEFRAWD
tara:strand:+ start:78 stop:446 length:369 start_codon:yes stop_codon:yes gene_type:complete